MQWPGGEAEYSWDRIFHQRTSSHLAISSCRRIFNQHCLKKLIILVLVFILYFCFLVCAATRHWAPLRKAQLPHPLFRQFFKKFYKFFWSTSVWIFWASFLFGTSFWEPFFPYLFTKSTTRHNGHPSFAFRKLAQAGNVVGSAHIWSRFLRR